MNFWATFNQILMLFTLILLGYIANKKGIITKALNKELSNVILYITLPALVIKSMQYSFSKDILAKSAKIIFISACMYIFTIFLSYIVVSASKIEGKTKDIIQFLLVFPNVGFMGYPVIYSLYGDSGVFYTALFNMPFEITVWTFGVYLMCRNSDQEEGFHIKKVFLNPGIPALITGYSLFLFSIKLPKPMYDTLNLLGSATTPMSMIVVGSILAGSNMKEAFKRKELLAVSFFRLLFISFIMYFVLKNGFAVKEFVLGVPVIIAAMPSAANAAIFATRFDNDHILASQGIFITTLFSILSIPIMVGLLRG